MRWLLLGVLSVLLIGIVSAAPHPYHNGFSAAETGFTLSGNTVRAVDTAVFHTGYYAVKGDVDWTPYELSGASHIGSADWIVNTADYTLPTLSGEYYVIVYSCTQGQVWDCHDGRWQLIVVNNAPGDDVLSLSAWVTVDSSTDDDVGKILVKPTDVSAAPWEVYALDVRDGRVRFILSDGTPDGWRNVNTSISLGVEHFVVGTYDGSTMRLYVDGSLANSEPASLTVGSSSQDLVVGRYPICCELDGTVGDYEIYNRVLSASEVADLYGTDPPPTCSGSNTRPCPIDNGDGEQTAGACVDGAWSDWGVCLVVSCEDDFSPNSARTACVEDGPVCVPNCDGKSCGSDGCTGSCGDCDNGLRCSDGACVPTSADGYCGDGECNNIETCSLCRVDCGICTLSNYDSYPSASTCGDGVCDTTEYCSVCAADCGSCPEIECPCDGDHDCINGVCLQKPTGSGGRYFVAVGGNGDGSFSDPWGRWDEAFDVVDPGDVIYIRGGVYMMPNRNDGYRVERSGTASNRITISNYPGERPVLDLSQASLGDLDDASQGYASCGSDDNSYALSFGRVSHYTIRGLEIRNLWQRDGCDSITGFSVGGTDMIVENMAVHDIGGNCFSTGNYDIIVRNSDAYHCVDYITTTPSPSSALPGNDGTGFGDGSWKNNAADVRYYGCRSWNNGDQGFSSGSLGHNEYDACWSMHNCALQGGGHGFKMGWISEYTPGILNRLYTNNIAAYNWAQGFGTNDQNYAGGTLDVFRNFAYHNGEDIGYGYGFRLMDSAASAEQERSKRDYRNNIAYRNDGPARAYYDADYTHSHNSWDTSGVTVNSDDFESLDISQLYRPRNADGSLPDITFGKVASGSDLITRGVYVE